MNSKDPKEHRPGNLNWLDSVIYTGISDLQEELSLTERDMLLNQFASSFTRYESLALGLKKVRYCLYRQYNDLLKARQATSQLSRDFNMSIKGRNDLVRARIDTSFGLAFQREQEGDFLGAKRQLQACELRSKVMFSPQITKIIQTEDALANIELVRLMQYREQLFRSVILLAADIAKGCSDQLEGNILEWSDLVQEAVIAARQGVEAYYPIFGRNTFVSFMHSWIKGILQKKINETTRTVPIPRTTLDRFVYVSKSIDALHLSLIDLRGGSWRRSSGKINEDTLLRITNKSNELQKNGKAFTLEEVEDLILSTQDEISIDTAKPFNLRISGVGHGEEMTFGETLPSQQPTEEEKLDGSLVGRRLMAIIRKYTTTEEYVIMELRFGMGVVQGYRTVADRYTQGCDKPMNKGKVSDIEGRVLIRLQQAAEGDPELRQQLQELLETVPFIPKR